MTYVFSIPIACIRPVIHMKRKVLVALGGNAILKYKEKGTVDEQFENIRTTCKHLVRIIKDGYKIQEVHGYFKGTCDECIKKEKKRKG